MSLDSFLMEPEDGVSFAWNLERGPRSVCLFIQRGATPGSYLQVYMSVQQFEDLCQRAAHLRNAVKDEREQVGAVAGAEKPGGAPLEEETPETPPALAGRES